MTTPLPTATLLVLEAATAAGSVALFAHGRLMASLPVVMGVGRDDQLFPSLTRLLHEADAPPLHGVVCGSGPGSFTSLRIAASLAKGLASGFGVPLYAVSSLLLAAAADASPSALPRELVVHADALRGDRFVLAVAQRADGMVRALGPWHRVPLAEVAALAAGRDVLAVGTPASLPDDAQHAPAPVVPRAEALLRVDPADWFTPVSLDAWEPDYGRLAEAQVKWEAAHQMALPTSSTATGAA